MATKIKLTEARARDAVEGEYADTEEQGLRLYVSKTSRTFGLYKWSPKEGRPIRKSIGPWPLISVDEARKRAKALSLKLLDGDSLKRPDKVTLEFVMNEHIRSNKAKGEVKDPAWIESLIRSSYKDWLHRDIGSITRSEIDDRHIDIATTRGRVIAARGVKALRTLYTFADKKELYLGRNVAKAVEVKDAQPRQRFLTPQELDRVRAALDDPSLASWVKPFVLLALLTGVRRSNLTGARWSWIDLDAAVMNIPATSSKNKLAMAPVLPPEAVEVLREWRKTSDGEWVFPSPKSKRGHLIEPWFAIKKVYEIAGIEDATLHDLRRTLGSHLTQAGAPLSTVQRALGHKNPATTARTYSISNDASVREFMAKLAAPKP